MPTAREALDSLTDLFGIIQTLKVPVPDDRHAMIARARSFVEAAALHRGLGPDVDGSSDMPGSRAIACNCSPGESCFQRLDGTIACEDTTGAAPARILVRFDGKQIARTYEELPRQSELIGDFKEGLPLYPVEARWPLVKRERMIGGGIEDVVATALKENTMLDAIMTACIWEGERVIGGIMHQVRTAVPTFNVEQWDTCYGHVIDRIVTSWMSQRVTTDPNHLKTLARDTFERMYGIEPSARLDGESFIYLDGDMNDQWHEFNRGYASAYAAITADVYLTLEKTGYRK
jgi:hypothetical protein